jgi:hypothetical protein
MNPIFMRNEYETIDVNKTRKYHQPNEKYSVEHEIRRKDFLLKSSDEKVKTIPDYYLRFSPILKTEVVTGTDEFLLITKEVLTPLTTFFFKISPTEHVSQILFLFDYLLKSFEILHQNKITNVNYGDIALKNNGTPVLFEFSEKPVPPYLLPIELFILNSFISEGKESLSIQNLEDMCVKFVKINGKKLTNESTRELISFFSFVANKSRPETVKLLTQYKGEWHVYGLANVFNNLIGKLEIPNLPSFLNQYLMNCISLLPSQRPKSCELRLLLTKNRHV